MIQDLMPSKSAQVKANPIFLILILKTNPFFVMYKRSVKLTFVRWNQITKLLGIHHAMSMLYVHLQKPLQVLHAHVTPDSLAMVSRVKKTPVRIRLLLLKSNNIFSTQI